MDNYVIALDIGGTKIAAAMLTVSGELLYHCQVPTCQTGPVAGYEQVRDLVLTVLRESGCDRKQVIGIGIGIPAVLETETDMILWAPNIKGWLDFPLRQQLEEELGLPVCIEYDGHTAILGEWWKGAAQGCHSAAMVIVGTGVGGGIIVDGKLWRGKNRLAGAVGWFAMTSTPDMQPPESKALGHWESIVAGPAIANKARALLPEYSTSSLHSIAPQEITAKDVFDQARQGDDCCRRIVSDTAAVLGMGIANIVDVIDPEIVILGGSIGRQGDLLLPLVRDMVQRWGQPICVRSVRIEIAKLDAQAGIYGAARGALLRLQSG